MRRKPPISRGITLRVRETVQKKSMQLLPTMTMMTVNGIQSPHRVEFPPPRKSERWRKKSSVVTAAIPRVPKIPGIREVKASKKLRHGAFNTSASKRWRGSRVNKLELKVYIKLHTCHTCLACTHGMLACSHPSNGGSRQHVYSADPCAQEEQGLCSAPSCDRKVSQR